MPHYLIRALCLLSLVVATACGPDSKDVYIGDSTMGPVTTSPTTQVQSCTDESSEPADGVDGPFTSFRVNPFLQLNETDSVWVVWEVETVDDVDGYVSWGCSDALPNRTKAQRRIGREGTWIFEAQIRRLQPYTAYRYRVEVEGQYNAPQTFHTLAPSHWELEQSFAVVSDMQPVGSGVVVDKWVEVTSDGVEGFLASEGRSVEDLGAVLIPGDLVSNGGSYNEWANGFFRGAETLGGRTALWPVPGNHDYYGSEPYFFHYFKLPENGSPEHPEHWYWKDFGNIRLFGLDSNPLYRSDTQLTWLRDQLSVACEDEHIDFVFAQLHHPHRSELWLAGEEDWSAEAVGILEEFASACDKPSIHLHGHTHAYGRGASRDHRHVWMNVATASGDIDYFGEYPSADYTEYNVAYDEYGFVMIDTEAGDDPNVRVRRVSRGDAITQLDNVVRDDFTVRRYNGLPETPELPAEVNNINPDCPQLPRGAFVDPDDDAFGASRIQVASDCDDFASPLADVWWQAENIWDDVDTQAEMDPTLPLVTTPLSPNTTYCYRVKVRDQNLGWSDWSDSKSFTTSDSATGEQRLINGGGEEGLTGWSGDIESVASETCEGPPAHEGDYYFAVGGLCKNQQAYGVATQRIDVTTDASEIDAGEVRFALSAYMRSWTGDDVPQMSLSFEDAAGAVLGSTDTIAGVGTTWTRYEVTAAAPAGTRSVLVTLEGTRNAGKDNDSYFDNVVVAQARDGLNPCPNIKILLSGE
jgi:hypothetical protein